LNYLHRSIWHSYPTKVFTEAWIKMLYPYLNYTLPDICAGDRVDD
jgi:hypothetical protein